MQNKNIKIIDIDLIKDLWGDRYGFPSDDAFLLDIKYAGKSAIEKISEIQKLEDENLVITSYNFDKGRIIVRVLVKDEDYFNKIFKDIDIVSKNFYKENGFNKFEMQIK